MAMEPNSQWFDNFVPTVQGSGKVMLTAENVVEFSGKIMEIKWLRSRYDLSLIEAKTLVEGKDTRKAALLKDQVRHLIQDSPLSKHLRASVLAELSNEAVQGF